MNDDTNWPRSLYVGTYTAPHTAPGEPFASEALGIYVFHRFEDGSLELTQTVPAENPSFLAFSPGRQALYAVSEMGPGADGTPAGKVLAFHRDPDTGTLTKLNSQPSGGTWPCHLSVTQDGGHLLASNYASGGFVVFPLTDDGHIAPMSDQQDARGSGPDTARQSQPHPHFIAEDPGLGLILGADLGQDRVYLWTLERKAGRLVPHATPYIQTAGGTGPRHLTVHPVSGYVLVLNELSSTIDVFAPPAQREPGAIWRQTLSALPPASPFGRPRFDPTNPGFVPAGGNTTAEIRLHPSGRFVYVTNRGMNSVAVFAFDDAFQRLSPVGWTSTCGERPRGMNICPEGRFLYVGNQGSNTIVVFAIDPEDGSLSDPLFEVPCPTPVDFAF
ncbi:lactonase family protein [Dinoroseobacter sp. S76]|uniref:lactonase family protein n=1 Tax=Dinoroseobacter sp. S76 TaxID=3415124 RepID=UPI003C7D06B6